MSSELKPCPRCGDTSLVILGDNHTSRVIKCSCGVEFRKTLHTTEEIIAAWNTRQSTEKEIDFKKADDELRKGLVQRFYYAFGEFSPEMERQAVEQYRTSPMFRALVDSFRASIMDWAARNFTQGATK